VPDNFWRGQPQG